MELEAKIEGLLFYKGEEIEIKEISEILGVSIEETEEALKKLENSLVGRGLVIVRKDNSVVLGISGELSEVIENIRKEEVTKELTKSALETLSIVLYKNGVTRSEIDYIRGVNSSFILRNLLVRGLVEKIIDPKDSRRFLYRPTFETLSYMGITSIGELPDYEKVRKDLEETLITGKTND
jgi:segregation and condensation protein B